MVKRSFYPYPSERLKFDSLYGNSNMIISVKSDFSVMPRCNGNEIGLFEILDKLILSTGSDSGGGDGGSNPPISFLREE